MKETGQRLDLLLVKRGLAESRSRAQGLIMAGAVRVNGQVITKAGSRVPAGEPLAVAEDSPYVSRAGEKLAGALDDFGVDPSGRDCLDAGASTGGFTDVLLQRGARRVISVDVGYGQLDWKLREDPRVTVLERTNVRRLSVRDLPFEPDLLVADLSFISLRVALQGLLSDTASISEAVLLVKPQFEAGPEQVGRGGLVRDPVVHVAVIRSVAESFDSLGFGALGVARAAVAGRKSGNQEYPLWLVRGADMELDEAGIREVVEDG